MGEAQRVDPNVLIAQLQAIREQIVALQGYALQLSQARDSVSKARDSLDVISKGGGDVIMALDPNMNAVISVRPVERGKVTVHLGLNVFARTSVEEAARILDEKRERLDKALGEVRKNLRNLSTLQDRYQLLIQQLLAQQEAAERRKS